MALTKRRIHFRYAALVCATTVFLVGCGPKMPETVRASGRVTYAGGDWPNEGMLYFASLGDGSGQVLRPTSAHFGRDGAFEVTSFTQGDGMVPGRYVVTIECWKTPPSMTGSPGVSAVPAKYRNQKTSDFLVEIETGQSSIEITFDVPKTP